MKRVIALLGSMALVAGLASIASVADPPSATATETVDFGITGPTATAAWGDGTLTPTTAVPRTTELFVIVGFRTDRAGLMRRAEAVSDPASASYGQYGSVAEIGVGFNASDAQIATVTGWFGDRGVDVDVDPTRSFAVASIPIEVLEEMTGTTFGTYAISNAPPNFVVITPTIEVSSIVAPLDAAIDRVAGATVLWNTATSSPAEVAGPKSHLDRLDPSVSVGVAPADGGTPWRTGTATDACPDAAALTRFGAPAGISPAQLRTAYGIDALWNAGFRGAGARIAIVDLNTYLPSDIATWRACFGLDGTPITDHLIGSPSFSSGSDETTLDLQTVIALAPDAERIDWFGVETTAASTVGQFLEMLAPAFDAALTGGVAPDAVSLSYGACESTMLDSDAGLRPGLSIFEQMIATGVASGIGTFVSTGDTGSTGCFPNDGSSSTDYRISAQFPSTSGWVTAVGGLNLTLDGSNAVVSSGVWNDRRFAVESLPRDVAIGSGSGGLSRMMPRMPWQTSVGAGTHRPVPDISAYADEYPGYFFLFDGEWATVGGTSAAAPLTATAFALQSSALASRGLPRLGFVAPRLGSLAASAEPAAATPIVDVVLGDNDAHEVGVYPATPGYDMASGFGWIRHDVLMATLAPDDPTPTPPVFTG